MALKKRSCFGTNTQTKAENAIVNSIQIKPFSKENLNYLKYNLPDILFLEGNILLNKFIIKKLENVRVMVLTPKYRPVNLTVLRWRN